MPKFHVISGSLTHGPRGQQKQIHIGGEVELSEAERKSIDPKGEILVTPEAFVELKKAADAQVAFEAKQKSLHAPAIALSRKLIDALAALKPAKKGE